MATSDPTNPSYYGYDQAVIECIDYIQSHSFDFLEGNIIKYVTRYEQKNGVEDLKKAAWYLDRLIKREEGKSKPYDQGLYSSICKAADDDLQFQTCPDMDGKSWATSDC